MQMHRDVSVFYFGYLFFFKRKVSYLAASSIATATATVIPTMGLLPKSYTLMNWS